MNANLFEYSKEEKNEREEDDYSNLDSVKDQIEKDAHEHVKNQIKRKWMCDSLDDSLLLMISKP